MENALRLLKQNQGQLNPADQAMVARLLEHKKTVLAHVQTLAGKAEGGLRIRVHGDLHLGQVLVIKGDAYLIDFEGEPARPLHERRGKHSPYKDVSGVLRSFDYAAAMAIHLHTVDSTADADAARQGVADRYLKEARQAFVEAYRLAAASLASASGRMLKAKTPHWRCSAWRRRPMKWPMKPRIAPPGCPCRCTVWSGY